MSARSIDTALAIVERDAEGLIRIRVKDGVQLNVNGIRDILAARKELSEGLRRGVIAITPDDMDFDIRIMNVDHYAKEDARAFTKAFAIVTKASLYTRLFNLYAVYFKTDFEVRIFADEPEALAWVRSRLAEPD